MSEGIVAACLTALTVAVVVLAWLLIRAEHALHRSRQESASPSGGSESPHDAAAASCACGDAPEAPSAYGDSVPLTTLMARDELLDSALTATRDGLWDWDRTTDALYFNPRFLEMLGYRRDAFPHHQDTWRELLHPDEREEVQLRQQKILESPEYGDSFEHIFRLRVADGSFRWFLGRILHVWRDAAGRAMRVVGANVDITDLKNLRDRVERGNARMEEALTSAGKGGWEWNVPDDAPSEGSCVFTMLGRAADGVSTGFASWAGHIHPEDRDLAVTFQTRIMDAADNGDSVECMYRFRIADGTYRWMLGRSSVIRRDAAGRAMRVVGVHTDITELKTLHSELDVRNERLNYAFTAARDGLWDWDMACGDVYYSARYLSMLGYMPGDFPPRQASWEERLHPEERESVIAEQRRYLENPELGDSFETTYRFRAADGTYRWILSRALVVRRDACGRALRVVGLNTDITELRRAQESLRILLQHDPLTGLYSRSHFEARLAGMRDGREDPVSLIVCNVDGLKLINNNLGHAEGDRLLVAAAGLLSSGVRRRDMTARIGGDELAVLLPACPRPAAEGVLGKIRAALKTYNADTTHPPIFLSMGLSTADFRTTSTARLFHEADKAMLREKSVRRSRSHAVILRWLEEHPEYVVEDRAAEASRNSPVSS